MQKQEKQFILNKGLILGLVLMLFPIIELFYGLDMSWTNYFLIFVLFWMIVYSYLVLKWSKEFASYYEIFPFKDAFRTLFLISAVAFGVLTVGKISLWNIYSPEKYIEINLSKIQTEYNLALKEISNDDRDCNYDSLSLFEDRNCLIIYGCQDSLIITVDSTNKIEIISKLDHINAFINPPLYQWRKIEENGISKTYFIGVLIYSLFFISIYCAILALFVRKKEKFIKID
jgi:hypothetical protein